MTSAGSKPKPLKTADVRKTINDALNDALNEGSYIEGVCDMKVEDSVKGESLKAVSVSI